MRYLVLCGLFCFSLTACFGPRKTGASYVTVSDTATKVLKGFLTRQVLENDTAFAWFKENMRYGSADPFAVEQFRTKAKKIRLLIFAGTWCHDSQNLLPKLYRLLDKSGYPEKYVQLVGVDRKKTAPGDLHLSWKLTSVPTFIVLYHGREAGRVVEYGNTGNMERELAQILARL